MNSVEREKLLTVFLYMEGFQGVTFSFLKYALDFSSTKEVEDFVKKFQQNFNSQVKGIKVANKANRVMIEVNAEIKNIVRDIYLKEKKRILSPAKIEVLALIAYKQPISQSLINKIRNKKSEHIIRWLLEKNFIKSEKKDKYNSKLLSTTEEFCRYFQINSPKDLPLTSPLPNTPKNF